MSTQLVGAPVSKDVFVQCYVEACPKAMNHWVRETGNNIINTLFTNTINIYTKITSVNTKLLLIIGEKLIPSEKYSMEEVPLSDYSLLMNLTIRSLEKRDFGGYICKSSNALGKAEGTVRLRGEHYVKLINVSNRPFLCCYFQRWISQWNRLVQLQHPDMSTQNHVKI